jgi:geranylgeranyl pyrophosphate synthase
LQLSQSGAVDDILQSALIGPAQEFLRRPSKQIRGQLVELGFTLAGREVDPERCALGAEVLETIHAGSLVVDDIQDESRFRRGQPALHRQHGVPLALNVGNWLYFWPLERLPQCGLPPEQELRLYRICHRALLRAHFGQAVDLGTPIDELPRARIPSVVLSSLELKTGALTALAVGLGAALAGANDEELKRLEKFGSGFGVALQMFDDLGNLKRRGSDGKQFEDLRLRRPSWVWAVAAEHFPSDAFEAFRSSVRELPEETALRRWLDAHDLAATGKTFALSYLERATAEIEGCKAGVNEARELGERLSAAYE